MSSRIPSSFDDLLASNRDQLQEMFTHQMTGGRSAQRQGTATTPTVEKSRAGDDAIVAELNKRFGLEWSSRSIGHKIDGDNVSADVEITIGDRSITQTGNDRIGADGDAEAAIQRAIAKALRSGADGLGSASKDTASQVGSVKAVPEQGPADLVQANRLDIALANIRAEVVLAAKRLAVSPGIDPIAMIMDANGQMISGDGGSFLAHLIEAHRLQFVPGDMLLLSDPFGSGGVAGTAKSCVLVSPVFDGGDRIAFVSIKAALTDVGGTAPGSAAANAGSVFAEGVRIPPVKIVEAGAQNEALLSLIFTNSRTPDANRADLMALVAACRGGAADVADLFARFGAETCFRQVDEIRSRSNAAMRALIRERLPEEPQSFEDVIDDDGLGNGPFALRLTVWREGDHAYFDWTGTAAQTPGPVNLCLHVGLAKALAGHLLTRALGDGLLRNDGYYDLMHVTLPKGSLLNPDFPAAVGRHAATLQRVKDVMAAAINRKYPERLGGAAGNTASLTYSGHGFHMVDTLEAAGAAGPMGDGMTAQGVSVEDLEADYPILIEVDRDLTDTAGAGRFRGGVGQERVYRFLQPGTVSVHDDRHVSQPWGANGGSPGARSQKWIERAGGGRDALPAKIEGLSVSAGDVLVFRTAGAGGCGDPMTRNAEAVRHDVAAGVVSIDAAARDYGVVIDAQGQIDRAATKALRAGTRGEGQHPKLFDRGNPA